MTGKQKTLLGCGIVFMAFAILLVAGAIWLFTGPEGGVKLNNEMEKNALQYLADHQILIPSEDLIAYYDATLSLDGTEAAILTTKRVIYHKDGRNDAIELKAIEDVRHRKETLIGDIIEIYASSGKSMKIEIAPLNQGETFRSSLMHAWQRAKTGKSTYERGAPADADKSLR